jgi:hypothetical protein
MKPGFLGDFWHRRDAARLLLAVASNLRIFARYLFWRCFWHYDYVAKQARRPTCEHVKPSLAPY